MAFLMKPPPKPLPKPEPRKVRMPGIVPYVISEVTEIGFKCTDTDGSTLEHRFGEFMAGVVITKRNGISRIYVSEGFLEHLAEYESRQD